MNSVRMKSLIDAHAALVMAQAALESLPANSPAYAAWEPVMRARVALSHDLAILPPVEVKPTP